MKNNTYLHKTHVYGRIATLIAIGFMLGIPTVICAVYGIWPSFGQVFQTAGPLLAIFVPSVVAEIFATVPTFGSASYLNSICGNVMNIKVPCALNALEITGAATGTEEGDCVMMSSVAVSAAVTMVIVATGVLLLVPLQPVLTLPAVQTASTYLLPALFGSMAVSNFLGKSAGDYIFEGKIKLVTIICVAVGIFSLFVYDLSGKEGYAMCGVIPLTILVARILYKKGIIKMVPKN